MKAYQLKITIKDSHPPIWRRVIVPAGLSFSQLSVVLNQVMGWCGYHLFSFEFSQRKLRIEELDEDFNEFAYDNYDFQEASETLIDQLLESEERFTYIYDFGDYWCHSVVVEKVITDHEYSYPLLLKTKGDTPYEDCGGIYGYYELLEKLKNPSDPEYENMKEWTDSHFTRQYSLEEMNDILKEYKLTGKKSKPMPQSRIYEDLMKKGQGFKQIQGSTLVPSKDDSHELGDVDLEELGAMIKQLERRIKQAENDGSRFLSGEKTMQSIFRCYTKEELTDIAKLHQLRGYSKYKKADLIQFLVRELLDKDVMCRYFTFLSDEELDIVKKYSVSSLDRYELQNEEEDVIGLIQGGYCGVTAMDEIMIPDEVIAAYRKNCDSEWKKVRRRTLELLWYLNGAADLYGVCTMKQVLELYEKYTGNHVDEFTMYSFCELIPDDQKVFIYDGNQLVCKLYQDEDMLTALIKEQKDQPFYVPSKKELIALGKEGFFPFDSYMEDLCTFIYYQLEEERDTAEIICKVIQFMFRNEKSVEDVLQMFEDDGYLEIPGVAIKMKERLTEVWKHTRRRSLRGNLPAADSKNATSETDFVPLNAGGKNGNILEFPVDIKKKIYPNDPCPCGSGKKYKKCCGKNKK